MAKLLHLLPSSSIPITISIEPLTPASFAPFGTVLQFPLSNSLPDRRSPIPALNSSEPAPPAITRHDNEPNALTPDHPNHQPHPVPANQGTALKFPDISPLLDRYASAPSSSSSSSSPSGPSSGTPKMSMFSCFPRRPTSSSQSQSQPGANFESNSPGSEGFVLPVPILERHPYTTQTFIPLGPAPKYLVVVAPTLHGRTAHDATTPSRSQATSPSPSPSTTTTTEIPDPPDLHSLRAFLATAAQAVTYAAGTWHSPMIVLGDARIDFVVVQFMSGVLAEDVEEVSLEVGVEGEGEGARGIGCGVLVEMGTLVSGQRAGGAEGKDMEEAWRKAKL